MKTPPAKRCAGLVLASVLVTVAILTTLLCALAQARRACAVRGRRAAMRLVALHLAEGLAEEGSTAPANEVRISERPFGALGSLRTDLGRLGADPATCLPRGLAVERSLVRWQGLEAVLVTVSWDEDRRRRSLRLSLPRPSNPGSVVR